MAAEVRKELLCDSEGTTGSSLLHVLLPCLPDWTALCGSHWSCSLAKAPRIQKTWRTSCAMAGAAARSLTSAWSIDQASVIRMEMHFPDSHVISIAKTTWKSIQPKCLWYQQLSIHECCHGPYKNHGKLNWWHVIKCSRLTISLVGRAWEWANQVLWHTLGNIDFKIWYIYVALVSKRLNEVTPHYSSLNDQWCVYISWVLQYVVRVFFEPSSVLGTTCAINHIHYTHQTLNVYIVIANRQCTSQKLNVTRHMTLSQLTRLCLSWPISRSTHTM